MYVVLQEELFEMFVVAGIGASDNLIKVAVSFVVN